MAIIIDNTIFRHYIPFPFVRRFKSIKKKINEIQARLYTRIFLEADSKRRFLDFLFE